MTCLEKADERQGVQAGQRRKEWRGWPAQREDERERGEGCSRKGWGLSFGRWSISGGESKRPRWSVWAAAESSQLVYSSPEGDSWRDNTEASERHQGKYYGERDEKFHVFKQKRETNPSTLYLVQIQLCKYCSKKNPKLLHLNSGRKKARNDLLGSILGWTGNHRFYVSKCKTSGKV